MSSQQMVDCLLRIKCAQEIAHRNDMAVPAVGKEECVAVKADEVIATVVRSEQQCVAVE